MEKLKTVFTFNRKYGWVWALRDWWNLTIHVFAHHNKRVRLYIDLDINQLQNIDKVYKVSYLLSKDKPHSACIIRIYESKIEPYDAEAEGEN
jgi:hypothetical protein